MGERLKCGKVSEDDLRKIANKLTVQDCMWVGRLLGLDDVSLDGIKVELGDDQFGCCHKILCLWIERTGTTKATYHQLARALLHPALHKRDLVEKYCLVHQEQKSGKYIILILYFISKNLSHSPQFKVDSTLSACLG